MKEVLPRMYDENEKRKDKDQAKKASSFPADGGFGDRAARLGHRKNRALCYGAHACR